VYLVSGDMLTSYKIASFVIKHQKDEVKIEIDNVRERFEKNGLLKEIVDPTKAVPIKEAEKAIIKKLKEFKLMEKSVPSAGIAANKDRIVLGRLMPDLNSFLSFT
jgi:oligoribonuclease (3'-5' exoribonuclease)